MDIIEACMLSKGDVFQMLDDPTYCVMLGWSYHLMMPIVAPCCNKSDYRFIHPFRPVIVQSFYL